MIYKFGLLGEYVELSNGKSSPDRNSSALYPVYGSNGFIGFCHGTNAPANTIVIGRVGSYCGSIHFSKNPCWITDNAIRAVAKESEQSRFWFYAMSNYDLHDLRAGSGQPLINQTSLKTLQLPVPNVQTRREISGLLGSLDDKIELNRRMSATLEETARALYRSWFVDFDPVHAKARGDAPAHMNPATAALFPDRFGEAGLPEGWRIGSLDEVVAFNPRESLEKGSIAPYLDMKALPAAGMISDTPYPRPLGSGMKFRARDTLLARITPCLENGKTSLVGDLVGHEVGWGSTEFIVMRAKGGIPASFPYCLARNDEFRERAIRTMTGSSGRQRADAKTLAALHTPIASSDVYEAFGQMTTPLVERALAMGRENQTLASLRDTLLPKLMSGELRVRDAERAVGEVA